VRHRHRAKAEAKAGIETLFNDFLPMPWEMLLPPGCTSVSSLKVTMKMRISLGSRPRNQTIEELMSNGTAVIGSPQTVRERIERIRDQTGLNIMIALLQFGVMSDQLARRNMELFASEVMPKLR
jgi:alkanesulfonate monooxygenase SsuD/methylene tetrahydromethanopterin reductase-like flavin-dependent oxidoreductase (luciferase family)